MWRPSPNVPQPSCSRSTQRIASPRVANRGLCCELVPVVTVWSTPRGARLEEFGLSDERDTIRDALRGASDGLLLAIREVDARERLKRSVEPGDPGFAPLARQVRIAAEAVLLMAQQEESKAAETSGRSAGAGLPTIETSPPRSDLAAILAEWRAIERLLDETDPASPDSRLLMEQFETLRDRYAQALAARYRPD
jgi:hypothetical protein